MKELLIILIFTVGLLISIMLIPGPQPKEIVGTITEYDIAYERLKRAINKLDSLLSSAAVIDSIQLYKSIERIK